MIEPSRYLSPDDEPQENLQLNRVKTEDTPPYEYLAALAGLFVLIIVRGLPFIHNGMWPLIIAVACGSALYATLEVKRPRLSLIWVNILAAEVGMLLALPAFAVYVAPWLGKVDGFSGLMAIIQQIALVGILGLFAGQLLPLKEYPRPVIIITGLFVFVAVSMLCALPI